MNFRIQTLYLLYLKIYRYVEVGRKGVELYRCYEIIEEID